MEKKSTVEVISNDERARVFWDRSDEKMKAAASKTKSFLEIPGVVEMIDGLKKETLAPADPKDLNRDYNC